MTCQRSPDGKHHYTAPTSHGIKARNQLPVVLQRGYAVDVVTCKHCMVGAQVRLDYRNGRVLIRERA